MLSASRGALLCLAATAGTASAAQSADLNGGTWQVIDPPAALKTSAGREPPLRPEARQLYDQRLAARRRGDSSFDSTENCLPPGLPRLLTLPANAFEFLQRPEEVVIHYQWNRLLRFVEMDQAPGEAAAPAYDGHSVGTWRDNTLTIRTMGFEEGTLLDNSGLPHSDALRLTERYTLSRDGQQLTAKITVDDSKTYSATWDTTLTFRRHQTDEVPEDFCLERRGFRWGKMLETR
jgi:hypothetical protein